jgi:sulfur-oxidizing protein SoxY
MTRGRCGGALPPFLPIMGVPLAALSVAVVLIMALLAAGARAAPTEAERAARWADLRHAIFGDRAVEEAGGLVAVTAPDRAEDAAIVPVAITVADKLAPALRGLYLVIDDNPSPLAAHFILGPAADPRHIETRVRIDTYTYLHAIAETADGRLYATARFIKAAGGCSAPAGKDQGLALQRLGKMKLVLAEHQKPNAPLDAKLLISHPNNSGMQIDQLTHYYIPADFMQTLKVTYNGELVFKLESDIAISEDPTFNFAFRAVGDGILAAEMLDSNQRRFRQSWPVRLAPQM